MSRLSVRASRVIAISVLAMTLGGCIVAGPPPHRYYVGPVIEVAPPPPRVEVYGPPPEPGYVWIGGYWAWNGGRHEWVGGHWDRPHPHQHWVAHHWVHEHDGWHLAEGHWERR